MTALSFLLRNAPFLTAGALMTLLSSFGQTFFISIFAGEIRTAFDLSHGDWGGLYMLGTGASALLMVWAGGLTDRFRVRGLGPVVLVGLAAGCLFMTANRSVWLLPLVIFALRFFGQGMCTHIAAVAMARWFAANRGKSLAVAALGYSFGEAVLPFLFVSLMALYDWRALWGLCGVVALAGIPAITWLLGKERTPGALAAEQRGTGMDGCHWTRRDALAHPLFWTMVPAILGQSAFLTALLFHQVHLSDVKGWGHLQFVSVFPLFSLVSVLSMVGSGWALDRSSAVRLTPWYQIPMVASFLTFALASGPWGLVCGFLLLGLSAGANATLPNAFWAEVYGTAHIGAIKAMAAAAMVLGSAIGPGLTGALIDLGIGLEAQFVAIAAFFAATTVAMKLGIARAARRLPSERVQAA